MRIAAVVTAYRPDERLAAVVDAVLGSCAEIVVADNTPAGEASASEKLDDPQVLVLRPGRNLGLAAALNAGIARIGPDVEAVLFLDQDSVLEPDVVPALAAHLAADPGVGVATPAPWDAAHERFYETFSARHGDVSDRAICITSGMLLRREVMDRVGGFREEFFVDYADLEYALRVRRAGARIIQDKRLKLPHSIGERRTHRFLGVPVVVTHHPAWRHYWTLRNGLITIREQGVRSPAWAVTALLFLARCAVQASMFEDDRSAHAAAVLRGIRDSFTGRRARRYVPQGAELSAPRRS